MMFWYGDSDCDFSDESEGCCSNGSSWDIDGSDEYGSEISESGYQLKKIIGPHLKLENNHLIKIADALQVGLGGTINFIAEDEFRYSDISVEVEEVGKLSFPLKSTCVRKLIDVSTKACFGKGEETVLNEDIRDTNEIPGKKLKVTFSKNSINQMLDRVRSKIFAKNCSLEVELHNMLIYSPGQFFDFHQDSEKATNMIGTLVIILPSPHIGGNLVVQHGTKEHIFVSENLGSKNFKCVSFYADCKHKIEKVREGFRVALTYKLILRREENPSLQPVNQDLKSAINDYFVSLQANPSSTNSPSKLVFFLDHSYSEHSLRWHLLKGEDQVKGDALLSVGKELDLVAYLVLVEIHHMWRNPRDYQTSRVVDIELDEVEYTLSHWINIKNEVHPRDKCSVRHGEVCWTKETSSSFKPKETEIEDFTGNTGLTLDYWYHRAAVVLWPDPSEVQMKFKLTPKKALKELRVVMKNPGHEEKVKKTVKAAGKFLYRGLSDETGFEKLVQIALYIKDKELSMSILSHFKWTLLDQDVAGSLAKLESQYGVDWCVVLLNKWKNEDPGPSYMNKADKVLKQMDSFVKKYLSSGGSSKVVELIIGEQINQISSQKNPTGRIKSAESKQLLTDRMRILYKLIFSCTLIQNMSFVKKAVEYIASNALLYPESQLAWMYFKLKEAIPSTSLTVYEPLQVYLQKSIRAVVAQGIKDAKDWSIAEKLYCECSICKRINTFLHSKTEKKKGCQVAKKERDHIVHEFSWLDLPVRLSNVDSQQKPLILTKSERLHRDANKTFAELKQYLKKINSRT